MNIIQTCIKMMPSLICNDYKDNVHTVLWECEKLTRGKKNHNLAKTETS